MTTWSAAPGAHTAVRRGDLAIVLGADATTTDGEPSRALVRALDAARTPEDVLDAMVAGGLRDAPDFAVLHLTGRTLTAWLRGAGRVRVEDARGTWRAADGDGARTWHEVTATGIVRATLDLGDDPGEASDRAPEGVHRAARLAADTADAPLETAPRPPRAVLALPDGRRIPVDGEVLLGRGPRAERIATAPLPTLVTVAAGPDVSRTHARVRPDGAGVVVEDLGSASGTVLESADGRQRLLHREAASAPVGSILDLGGVRVRVEGAR